MKKGKLIKGICLVLVLVMLGFVSAFAKPVSTKEKIYEWTMISIHPKAAYPQTISYARALEKATGGAIKVKMLFAGEHPYRFEDVMTMMRDRKSDITWTGPWAVSGTEPETEILDFPFIISAGDELTALLTDPHYTERYKDVIDMAIKKPLAKWNQIPLFYETRWVLGVGFDDFLDSFDSLKGKKIQAHTLGLSLFVQSMGGIPVNIPYADRYVALQRKTIVGWISAFSGSYKVRWTEVAKYFTACPVYSAPCWIVVHKDAFNELSKDLQGKVLQWAKEQQEWIHEYQNKIENDSITEAMRRDGLRATWIDPVFSEKVRDKMKAEAWPKMIKRMRDPASVEQIIKRLDEFHIEWVKSHKK